MPRQPVTDADVRGGGAARADDVAGTGPASEPPPRVVDLNDLDGPGTKASNSAQSPTLELLPPSPPRSLLGSDCDDEDGGGGVEASRAGAGGGGGGVGRTGAGAGAALLAPVRGLKAIARLCAGGGAVAYAAARRRRRLDGDPDVDGALGGTYARESSGWRGASFDSARSGSTDGQGQHKVQILLGGRETPDALVSSLSRGSHDDYRGDEGVQARSAPHSPVPPSSADASGHLSAPPTARGFSVGSGSSSTSPAVSPRASLDAGMSDYSDTSPSQTPSAWRWAWASRSSDPGVSASTSPVDPDVYEPDTPQAAPPTPLTAADPARTPFAAEVVIRGWQVVGGTSFDSSARVGAYVVYDIEIALRGGARVSILRRYTEFVRLRSDLRRAFPHLRQTIPALPGKNHMHKFSPEFLADRRPRLQRFLRTVMLHPEMGRGGDNSVLGRWVLGETRSPAPPSNGGRLGGAI